MKRLEIKLAGDELYEEFQRIYDESVDRGAGKDMILCQDLAQNKMRSSAS